MPVSIAVIIVTHNSGSVLPLCMEALLGQTRTPDKVVIVDNASTTTDYLDSIPTTLQPCIIRNAINHGFCEGNNIGYSLCTGDSYVLFLNPDAFLHPEFIERALRFMEEPKHARVGALTGTLLGYDMRTLRPTGRIDSTGIFQTTYGRWYDRGQGVYESALTLPNDPADVPAICGALMFCRNAALQDTSLSSTEIFDKTFFMYKEDIDLSLRLQRRGWRTVYVPHLSCYHVRGWQQRGRMSLHAKKLSARNELRLSLRNRCKGLPYSLAKLAFVQLESMWTP